jgi:hypothetical protein
MKWRPHVLPQQQGQLLPKADNQPQVRPDSVPKSKTITGSTLNTTFANVMNGISNPLAGGDAVTANAIVQSVEAGLQGSGEEVREDAKRTEVRSSDRPTLPPQQQQHQAPKSPTTSSSSATAPSAPAEGLAAAG